MAKATSVNDPIWFTAMTTTLVQLPMVRRPFTLKQRLNIVGAQVATDGWGRIFD
jgi:hypothetical protein